MKVFTVLPIVSIAVDYASTEFDVIQPKCDVVPSYEQAVGTTCDVTNQYSNGESCTVYCSTAVTRTCSCTKTLGGIITIMKADGCEWIGDDCIIETTETSIATSVETNAANVDECTSAANAMAASVKENLEKQAGTYDEIGSVTADCSEANTTERKRRSIARTRRSTSFTIGIEAVITTTKVDDAPPEEVEDNNDTSENSDDTSDSSDSNTSTAAFSLTDTIESVIKETVEDAVEEVAADTTLNVGVSIPEAGLSVQKEEETVSEKADRTEVKVVVEDAEETTDDSPSENETEVEIDDTAEDDTEDTAEDESGDTAEDETKDTTEDETDKIKEIDEQVAVLQTEITFYQDVVTKVVDDLAALETHDEEHATELLELAKMIEELENAQKKAKKDKMVAFMMNLNLMNQVQQLQAQQQQESAPDMSVYKKEARQMVHGLEDRMMGVVGALGQKIQSMSNMLNGGYQPTSYRIAK